MFAAEHFSYRDTGAFSKLVLDYLDDAGALHNFYQHYPSKEGFSKALREKQLQSVDRAVLVEVLTDQYKALPADAVVNKNILSLTDAQTFTVCTAHQPNLFSGPLYFLYKIVHAIRLAEELKKEFPQQNFVPVFYMGSEDADLEELNHFTVEGKKYRWSTKQKGAVGRMVIDKEIKELIDELEGQLGVKPFGEEVCGLLRGCYQPEQTIQQATFQLVHRLFGKWGLVVLIADDSRLKRQMLPVFEDDIFKQTPSKLVERTSAELNKYYSVQATPREINLFYLKEDIRQRIIFYKNKFVVHETDLVFSEEELRVELRNHPERFSPNVILRGLYQETILPNIAFIGGGGELAYWLQLKDLFQNYQVQFPVLVLRNSFMLLDQKQQAGIAELQLKTRDLFNSALHILDKIIEKNGAVPQLNGEVQQLELIYESLVQLASAADASLEKHVVALQVKSRRQIENLQKKILRAERRKLEATRRKIERLKNALFPGNGLQERVENFTSYYATMGPAFLDELYQHSLGWQQQFTVLKHQTHLPS